MHQLSLAIIFYTTAPCCSSSLVLFLWPELFKCFFTRLSAGFLKCHKLNLFCLHLALNEDVKKKKYYHFLLLEGINGGKKGKSVQKYAAFFRALYQFYSFFPLKMFLPLLYWMNRSIISELCDAFRCVLPHLDVFPFASITAFPFKTLTAS